MRRYLLLFLLLIPFLMPKNVFAQVRYEEAIPSSAFVLLRATDQAMSTQSISTASYNGQLYYGFTFGSSGTRYGIMYNYAERTTINDKYIESIHFSLLSGVVKTYSLDPYSVYLKDTYNNTITCHGTWAQNHQHYQGTNDTYYYYNNEVATYYCEKGHLSGPFSVNISNSFENIGTNDNGFIGISELSIHYNDGTNQDSSTLNDIKGNTKETNDLIKNDNVDGANTQGSSFFSNFNSNTHGLSGIVSSPIRLINSLSSSTCSPLTFTIPFVNSQVALPCMSSIYSTYFPTLLSVYQLITTGLIAYKILINLFGVVKGLQDPDSSRIEVVDL